MNSLALFGGRPVREQPFPAYKVIGEEEKAAVMDVLDSGILSRYLGCWHDDFYGGPQVQAFERAWAETFDARHAVAVNSCTSGLFAAIGAAGIGPGDEVIVPPFTMSATVMAPLVYNAVPVFADIDPDTYCLDAESVRQRVTPRTKAIMVVQLFGQTADMDAIMAIAQEYDLVVIEDCAQAPFATYKGRPAGTLGHMGVFSLNYHKHIHTGEGGVVTTNDERLAERLQLIRNHAESVVGDKGVSDLVNMMGFNFRLGEMEAAIGLSQLRKGPDLIDQRRRNIQYLEQQLAGLDGLEMPRVGEGNRHVYYIHALRYDADVVGVPRELFVKAVAAELPATELREGEGPLIGYGYVPPLYLLPLFQQRQGYGKLRCPFSCPHYNGIPDYRKGLCPNVEYAHATIVTHEMMRPPMSEKDLDDVAAAFHKVYEQRSVLRDAATDL